MSLCVLVHNSRQADDTQTSGQPLDEEPRARATAACSMALLRASCCRPQGQPWNPVEAVSCCGLTTTHGGAVSTPDSLLRTIPEQLIRNRAENTGPPYHLPRIHCDTCLVCCNLKGRRLGIAHTCEVNRGLTRT